MFSSWSLVLCSPLLLLPALAAEQDPPPGKEARSEGSTERIGEAWREIEGRRGEIATREEDPLRIASEAAKTAEVRAELVARLAAAGVKVDLEAEEIRMPGWLGTPRMPLEFLLVHRRGPNHETLLTTDVRPSALTTAVHLLGLEPGRNVSWVEKDPFPTEEEVRAGARTHDIVAPTGDGMFLYVEWEQDGLKRSYRVEDLVVTEIDGRAMPYTPWVFLGSSFQSMGEGEPELFSADVEGGIVSLCYFSQGSQVFTNPHPLALQPIFWPNHTLVPETDTEVELIFRRQPREARAR